MPRKSKHQEPIPVGPIEETDGTGVPTSDPADEASASPTRDDISMRAREIWEVKGCPLGRDLEIWLAAEHDLTESRS